MSIELPIKFCDYREYKGKNRRYQATELQSILCYTEWRFFSEIIEKTQVACSKSKNNNNSHLGVNTKIVTLGNTPKLIIDYEKYTFLFNHPKYEFLL